MKKIKDLFKTYKLFILSFAAGALLPLAFAPYYLGIFAFACPFLLLYSSEKSKPKEAAMHGYLFGLGSFGFGVYWVFHSIFHYGQTSATLAYIITGLFIAILALFPALALYITNRLFSGRTILRATLGFPVVWVLVEILRGFFLTGFPWLYLGTSQITNGALRPYATIGSVWLVSWAILVTIGCIYSIMVFFAQHQKNKKIVYKLIGVFVGIWIAGGLLNRIEWVKPVTDDISVALIQGNIAQQMRWDPKEVVNIMNTYEELTLKAFDSAIIIWPEGAIPMPLPYSEAYFNTMNELALQNNSALIAGVPVKAPDKEAYYNALIGVGKAQGYYYKERLVPFGEFVPFETLLRGLIGFFDLPMSNFISRDNPDRTLTAFGINFAPAICYEIAYPTLVRENAKHADAIITVSNDTWFGKTIGPMQHLEIAQWRAIETGRYILRATNTGITAIIAPNGHADMAEQFVPTIFKGQLRILTGQTPWVRFGIWPLLLGLFFVLAYPFLPMLPGFITEKKKAYKKAQKKKKRKKSSTD